ncbi:lysR family regulatory protein [Ilyonectria robusta]
MWPFSPMKPTQPATIPTDTIIPLHFLDDQPVHRSIVLDLTLRFDDALDSETLRIALVRLMELGPWRKLGARLRMNEAGRLEYHIPTSFDETRPGFSYTRIKHDINIKDHPLASRLPKMSSRPSVQANPADFISLVRRPDAPKKLDDYLFADEPQLCLYIVSFEDATLVSLSWPHTFLDAMGMATLLNAWSLVLSGQEDRVPPFHGFNADPLATLGSTPVEQSMLASYQVTGLGMLGFVARYMFEQLWWREEETRVVCLPHSYLQAMKQTAIQELAAQDASGSEPFLSDGDIISAWWTRLAIQHLPRTSTRTILISNGFSLRGVLANDLLPSGTAYMSNAVYAVFAFMSASDVFNKPLSYVASQVRQSIQEQGTREQIEAFAALLKTATEATGRAPIFGDSSTQMLNFSNWTKGRLFDVDFSTASANLKPYPQLMERPNTLGRPSYVQVITHLNGFSGRYSFPIFGKDTAGNYWSAGTLRASQWLGIEEALKGM